MQVDNAGGALRPSVDLMAARFFSELNEFEGVSRSGAVETPFGTVPAPGHARVRRSWSASGSPGS